MQRKLTFRYLLIIFFFLVGCTNNTQIDVDIHDDYEEGGREYSITPLDGGEYPFFEPIVPKDGVLHNKFSLTHDFSFDAKYGLLVLVDYLQVNFLVNGEQYSFYPIKLGANETIELELEVQELDDANDILYLIVFQPDYQLEEGDISRAMDLFLDSYIKSPLNEGEKSMDELLFEKPSQISQEGVNSDQMRLLREMNEFILMTRAKSEEEIYFEIGNDLEQDIPYSIIALQNWEQIPFENGDLIKHVKVKPGNSHYYDLTLPSVDDNVNYQLIAFPHLAVEGLYSNILSSPRIVIEK